MTEVIVCLTDTTAVQVRRKARRWKAESGSQAGHARAEAGKQEAGPGSRETEMCKLPHWFYFQNTVHVSKRTRPESVRVRERGPPPKLSNRKGTASGIVPQVPPASRFLPAECAHRTQ